MADRVDGHVDADGRVRPAVECASAEELALQDLPMNHRGVSGRCRRTADTHRLSASARDAPARTRLDRRCRSPAPSGSSRVSSRHSTAPPLGTRRPSSLAGNTRVSLTTSRSPHRRKRGRSRMPRVRHRAADSVQHEQPRLASRRGGLRDQLVRKIKVEVGYFHGWSFTEVTEATASSTPRSFFALSPPIRQISRRPIHKRISTGSSASPKSTRPHRLRNSQSPAVAREPGSA